ncbi:peptidyl-tRNA hydrolase Pth2 [Sulfuracidifex metallicus]|uniref:peptidyl-tRNA hydrolase Pth2 n=1 Tax=Sulfuracidifex metallicus TaxID=47303 RepID=UPI002274780F|nr:peptidyl-tRNA hydrolase Pth2 [Sulfuracidifex metallicus]MCY0849282.1 peptidyl-tRNA hydrolase Pth2 [Sulfuracidifex metallicus]
MKMVIIVRNDLQMGKGKVASQVAHAAVSLVLEIVQHEKVPFSDWLKEWLDEGQPKIVVKVNSEEELIQRINRARQEGLLTTLIHDAGRTQINPGTLTCGGIGPAPDHLIDKITGDLKLL